MLYSALKTLLSTVLLSSTLAVLIGCQNANISTASSNNHETVSQDNPAIDNSIQGESTQCGPFNPNEMVICTMQYDPVCVTQKQADGTISYRTAGNSCSACSTAESISYIEGECPV